MRCPPPTHLCDSQKFPGHLSLYPGHALFCKYLFPQIRYLHSAGVQVIPLLTPTHTQTVGRGFIWAYPSPHSWSMLFPYRCSKSSIKTLATWGDCHLSHLSDSGHRWLPFSKSLIHNSQLSSLLHSHPRELHCPWWRSAQPPGLGCWGLSCPENGILHPQSNLSSPVTALPLASFTFQPKQPQTIQVL